MTISGRRTYFAKVNHRSMSVGLTRVVQDTSPEGGTLIARAKQECYSARRRRSRLQAPGPARAVAVRVAEFLAPACKS